MTVGGKAAGEEGVFARLYLRRCAKPLVWLLSKTSVTPNQVTVSFLALMLLGAVAHIDQRHPWMPIVGAALLQLGLILDAADGAIARMRRVYSIKGVYLDMVGHRLVHAVLFTSIGFGVWLRDGRITPVVLGTMASFGELALTMMLYAKWRALVDHPETLRGELDKLSAIPPSDRRRRKAGFQDRGPRRHVFYRIIDVWFGVDYVGALLLTTLVLALAHRSEYLLWMYGPLQFGRCIGQVAVRVARPFEPERPEALLAGPAQDPASDGAE